MMLMHFDPSSLLGLDDLSDGLHPNDVGHLKIYEFVRGS